MAENRKEATIKKAKIWLPFILAACLTLRVTFQMGSHLLYVHGISCLRYEARDTKQTIYLETKITVVDQRPKKQVDMKVFVNLKSFCKLNIFL